MAETLLRRRQRVYAADGTYVGRLLQCDARFLVIGRTRWEPDHCIVPNEDVAATTRNVVILRRMPDEILPETAEVWRPPRDRVGSANGVDLEPLRAGMAEIDDRYVGTAPARASERADRTGPERDRASPPPPPRPAERTRTAEPARGAVGVAAGGVAEVEDPSVPVSAMARRGSVSPKYLALVLREAGFTPREAQAVAAAGFDPLSKLVRGDSLPR